MARNPSIFQETGMEAMNNGYFVAGNIIGGTMSADVTPFHPNMLLDHGSLGFGLGGTPVSATEIGAQFAANNVTIASLANHHLSAAPRQQDELLAGASEEVGCGVDVTGGGSCSAASLRWLDQSGGMAVWLPSSTAWHGNWTSAYDRPRAVSVHEPYLAGIQDAAGFRYPPLTACGGGPGAPATSELSLALCSHSSSESVPNTTGQCSSGASRSALTELPRARSSSAPFSIVVARSRYAAVAQEVLNDIVGRLLDGVADVAADSGSGIDSDAGPLTWSVDASSVVSSNRLMATSSEDGAGTRWREAQRVRTDLLKMLEMLDQKYIQCLDEIQSTTAKFNGLMQHGGVGNDNICAPFAHRAVLAMYVGLKRRIAGKAMAAASGPACWAESSSATAGDMERSWESALIQKHWAAAHQKARRGEQQCWRPQRGLPERSVAVLKNWMFEHFLKPYPDDHEKDVLAARSNLTRNQVSNWFINARVRIWKPMIEEMYKDMKRSSAGEQGMEMEPQQNMSNEQSNVNYTAAL